MPETLVARFGTTCQACGMPIAVGDTIVRDGDCWVHENCLEAAPKRGGVCPQCHMEMPLTGKCDCDD